MNEEQRIAIATPKAERSDRQKQIIFGDCDSARSLNSYRARALELIRRLENNEPLTKADIKEAKHYKKNGIL